MKKNFGSGVIKEMLRIARKIQSKEPNNYCKVEIEVWKFSSGTEEAKIRVATKYDDKTFTSFDELYQAKLF